jgi:predicted transcriptional regulator
MGVSSVMIVKMAIIIAIKWENMRKLILNTMIRFQNCLKKIRKNTMKNSDKVTVKVGSIEEFFDEMHKIMQAVDRGEVVKSQNTITFGDPRDMLQFLSPKRMEVYTAIKKHPDSITNIAKSVERNRSSVSKDIKELLRAGIVKIDSIINPGHGRIKVVKPAYPNIILQASL